MIGGGSGPKNFLKSSRVYMIENLFSNPKLFTECKIMPFRDSVAVIVRIGMPSKRDFPFIKLEGKMPLFDLKCALNQPKMVQNT